MHASVWLPNRRVTPRWLLTRLPDEMNGYYSDWSCAANSMRLWRWSCGRHLVKTFAGFGSGEA